MTEKPKKPLFNTQSSTDEILGETDLVSLLGLKRSVARGFYFNILLLFFLVLFLSVVFLYAIYFDKKYFLYLIGISLFSALYLIPYQIYINKKKAVVELETQEVFEKINLFISDINQDRQVMDAFKAKIVHYSHLKGLTEKLSMCFFNHFINFCIR